MTEETGKYARHQLFHKISCDNYPTTVHFIYFPNHKAEATQVLMLHTRTEHAVIYRLC